MNRYRKVSYLLHAFVYWRISRLHGILKSDSIAATLHINHINFKLIFALFRCHSLLPLSFLESTGMPALVPFPSSFCYEYIIFAAVKKPQTHFLNMSEAVILLVNGAAVTIVPSKFRLILSEKSPFSNISANWSVLVINMRHLLFLFLRGKNSTLNNVDSLPF